ncbi:MAG TPA: VOC family protein [Chloroflexota bacterium]|nr:VOC family protein [Chloroflexota bacterium]
MKVHGIGSWNFHADDLEAMTRFYEQVLGGEIRARQNLDGTKVVRIKVGDTGLGLFDTSEKRRENVPHHTFRIEAPADSAELVKELEGRGAKVHAVRQHENDGGYSVYVKDPGGNELELSWSGS